MEKKNDINEALLHSLLFLTTSFLKLISKKHGRVRNLGSQCVSQRQCVCHTEGQCETFIAAIQTSSILRNEVLFSMEMRPSVFKLIKFVELR